VGPQFQGFLKSSGTLLPSAGEILAWECARDRGDPIERSLNFRRAPRPPGAYWRRMPATRAVRFAFGVAVRRRFASQAAARLGQIASARNGQPGEVAHGEPDRKARFKLEPPRWEGPAPR